MSNVVFFGDSVMAGEGVSPHLHFVSLLARDVDQEFPGRFSVLNAGQNNDTTRMALERMPNDVQRFRPVVLVAQFGMNDCNKWKSDFDLPRVSLEAYCANMLEIAARAIRFGARRVIFLTSHATDKGWNYEGDRKRYNEALCATAKANGIEVIDIAAGWPLHSDGLLIDKIHLSEGGHKLYRREIQPYLLNALRSVPE